MHEQLNNSEDDYEYNTQDAETTSLDSMEADFIEKYGEDATEEQWSEYFVDRIRHDETLDYKAIEAFLGCSEESDAIHQALSERLASGEEVKEILGEIGEKYDKNGFPDIVDLAKMVEMVKDGDSLKQCKDFFSNYIVDKTEEEIRKGASDAFRELTMVACLNPELLGAEPQSPIAKTAIKIAEFCGDSETIAPDKEESYTVKSFGKLFAYEQFSGIDLFDGKGPTKIAQDYLVYSGINKDSIFYDDTHKRVVEIEEQANVDGRTHANICAALIRGFGEETIDYLANSESYDKSEILAPFMAFSSEEEFMSLLPKAHMDEFQNEYRPAIEKYKEIKAEQKDDFLATEELMKVAGEYSNDLTKLDAWKNRLVQEMYDGRMKAKEEKIELEQNRRRQEWLERGINSRLTTLDEIEVQSYIQDSGIMRENREYNGQKVPIYKISPDYPFRSVVTWINMPNTLTSTGLSKRIRLRESLQVDPSVWMKNKEEAVAERGSYSIHASYTENRNGHASAEPNEIFYGFGHIHAKSLIEIHLSDADTSDSASEELAKYEVEDFKDFDISLSNNYTELVLRRYHENGKPLYVPDYIVCYALEPTDGMLMHAAYFHIPVIIVEGEKAE